MLASFYKEPISVILLKLLSFFCGGLSACPLSREIGPFHYVGLRSMWHCHGVNRPSYEQFGGKMLITHRAWVIVGWVTRDVEKYCHTCWIVFQWSRFVCAMRWDFDSVMAGFSSWVWMYRYRRYLIIGLEKTNQFDANSFSENFNSQTYLNSVGKFPVRHKNNAHTHRSSRVRVGTNCDFNQYKKQSSLFHQTLNLRVPRGKIRFTPQKLKVLQ